jgi:hypothetical protein
MANFKQNTRYTNGAVTKNRKLKDFLVLRRPLNLKSADGDTFLEIPKEILHRPDLIADRVYGNPDLWWVIYEFNGIKDPLFDLKPGQVLRIPEIGRVLAAIDKMSL